MMTTNQEFKNAALAALKGNWAPAVLATIVFMIIASVFSVSEYLFDPTEQIALYTGVACFSGLFTFLVLIPLSVGYYNSFRSLYNNSDREILRNTFKGFNNYFHVLGTMILEGLVVVLGCFVFLIPGIILSFAYAMVPFIIQDEPELSAVQTLKKSRMMMKGHKFDFFWLDLSFIGWGILAICTLGIGMFWLMPYMYTSISVFYENLKAEQNPAAPEEQAAAPAAEPAAQTTPAE